MARDRTYARPAPISVANPVGALRLLILGGFALATLLWAASVVLDWQAPETVRYVLPLGFYGLVTTAFVWPRVGKGAYSVFHIPTFASLANFLRFGLITLALYADPSLLNAHFHGDYQPIRVTLLYFIGGMFAYWAGCSLVPAKGEESLRRDSGPGAPSAGAEGDANLPILWLTYLLVLSVRVYELYTTGMGRGIGAFGDRNENVAAIQLFAVVDTAGTWCFIVLTIEKFSHPANGFLRGAFWVALVIECCFGLAGGAKSSALMPFFLAAAISALITRKIKKGWLIAPFVLLVALYPLSMASRELRSEHGTGVATVQRWGAAAGYAGAKTPGVSGWLASGWDSTMHRLALLQEMALAMNLGDRAESVRTDERWWMVPFYPFVPRFLWPSKPILLKGQRFSIAVGSTAASSEAITIPGDLYLEFGLPGLAIGMFLWGMLAQLLTNMITGPLNKRSLVIYMGVFWGLIFFESDVFGLATGLMKSLLMLWVFVRIIYAPPRGVKRSPASRLNQNSV